MFIARFRRYIEKFGGYIVSDEYYEKDLYKKEKVYPISNIDKNTPIIVTLMKKSAMQIIGKIKDRKNVLFLSIKC